MPRLGQSLITVIFYCSGLLVVLSSSYVTPLNRYFCDAIRIWCIGRRLRIVRVMIHTGRLCFQIQVLLLITSVSLRITTGYTWHSTCAWGIHRTICRYWCCKRTEGCRYWRRDRTWRRIRIVSNRVSWLRKTVVSPKTWWALLPVVGAVIRVHGRRVFGRSFKANWPTIEEAVQIWNHGLVLAKYWRIIFLLFPPFGSSIFKPNLKATGESQISTQSLKGTLFQKHLMKT